MATEDEQPSSSSYSVSYYNSSYNEVPSLGPIAVIVPLVLGIITLFALVGNSLVIYIVLRYRNMRSSVTNFYIVNVAVSDIVFVVVCAPLTSASYALVNWPLGEFLCKLNAYIQCVSVQATCTTLTAMTVDRYYVIMSPLASRRTRTIFRASMVCAAIWIFSAAIQTPSPIFYQLEKHNNWYGEVDVYCKFTLEKPTALLAYMVYLAISTFLLPMLIIAVCYGLILSHLWSLSRVGRCHATAPRSDTTANYDALAPQQRHGGAVAPAQSSARTASKTWKTTRIVLFVVLLFAVCWAPIQALNVWDAINHELFRGSVHANNLRVFCLCLAYANSCINPFVYALAGASYKHHLMQMVSGNSKRGRSFNSRFSPTGGGNSYRSVRRMSRTEATSVSTCV